jgi:3-isopropylmalate/(R)-2-methylmalate dehydratase small subunit
MNPITKISGLVAPLDRDNVDTDAIIPKQFLKSISRTGFGPHLFDEWRWLDHGEPGMDLSTRRPNPNFILNEPRYLGAKILLGRRNFGCGSSREHAVWALQQFGIEAVIAPDFADIFQNNALKNGLIPIQLSEQVIESLFKMTFSTNYYALDIELESQLVKDSNGNLYPFELDPFRKDCLIRGVDEVDLVLLQANKIKEYEVLARSNQPWLFPEVGKCP